MINKETINNIFRMQEYWKALSTRQRVDIYFEAFDYDLRGDHVWYSEFNFDIL